MPDQFDRSRCNELSGLILDRLDIEFTSTPPAPELLTAAVGEQPSRSC